MSFAHLTLPVKDVPMTSRFFQEVMGWPQLSMPQNIDIEADWLKINDSQQLHLLGIENAPASQDEEFGRHYAFFHPVNDFDGLMERVRQNGGEIVEPIRETPFRRLFFRDPNGYVFELISQEDYCIEN